MFTRQFTNKNYEINKNIHNNFGNAPKKQCGGMNLLEKLLLFLEIFEDELWALVIAVPAALICWFVRRVRLKRSLGRRFKEIRRKTRLNEIIRFLLAIWSIAVVILTIIPEHLLFWKWYFSLTDELHYYLRLPPSWDPIPAYIPLDDFVLNIILFIPLGLALPFVLKRPNIGKAALIGSICTFAIEFLQGFIADRIGCLTDVFTNTLGTVIGYLLYLLMKLIFPKFTALCKTDAGDVYPVIRK